MKPLKITELNNAQLLKEVKKDTNELIVRYQLLNKIYKRDQKTDRKVIIKDINEVIKALKTHIKDLNISVLVEAKNPSDLKLKSLLNVAIEELKEHTAHYTKQLKAIEPAITEQN